MPLQVNCKRSKLTGANDSPALERLETPPNPSVVIPFSRDTDFVERGILDQIHQKCAVLGSRTALVGLGGVGWAQTLLLLQMANCCEASRNLPSNTRIEPKTDPPKRGFSGSTQAMPPGLSRAFEILQTASRSLGGRIQRPMFSSLYTTGCATKNKGHGSLYLIMWIMLASSSKLKTAIRMGT